MADKIIRKLAPITSADELKLEPIPDEVVESMEKNIDALSRLVCTAWRIPQSWFASSGHIDGLRASCTNIDEIHDLHIDIPFEVYPLRPQQILKLAPNNDSNNEKEKNNMAKSSKNKKTENEEWIWVEGYKGTDKNMVCRDYQYELGKQFDMTEGADIKECSSGFHLCKDLKDVFNYVSIGDRNRFFKVHALVRKADYDRYGTVKSPRDTRAFYYGSIPTYDKLVAKSIVFISELTPDEVFAPMGDTCKDWSTEDKILAMKVGCAPVAGNIKTRKLIALGYSEPFARYIVNETLYDVAYAVGTQEDLSMDMKVAFIMRGDD